MNEAERIHKILKGDTSSFGYFVDTYQDMALTIAFRICGNKQDAEDIVQNAYVKAYHNLHTFRSDSKFSTWFYRIVYNTAITETKTSVYITEFEDYKTLEQNSFSDWDAIKCMEEQERKEMIEKVLNKMPKDESLVLTLFYLEENSIKDVVQIMGLTETNVKVKLHRARKRFGAMVEEMNEKEVIRF